MRNRKKNSVCSKVISVIIFLASVTVFGGELDINGDFAKIGKNNLPTGWVQHNYYGYLAKLKIVPGENAGEKALLIYDNKGKHGECVRTAKRKRHPARAGDKITISIKCKGKGTGWIGIYTWSSKGKWCGATPEKHFELSDQWETHQFETYVPDGRKYSTAYINITFGIKKDAEAAFSNIKVLQEKTPYVGSLKFPRNWTVFLPINRKFVPSPEQLRTIPSEFGKAKPMVVSLIGNELDFAPLFGGQKTYNCAWAFAEIDSPFDCEYTLGAGADWWMQYFVNSEKVIDTTSIGNCKFPFQINNHVVNVNLKKGRNILAVKFVSGSKSSVLMMGGPNELRKLKSKIKITQTSNMDDYDKSAKRPGNPALIKDNPTPGLLTVTGQGVYTAAPETKICFPGKTFTLPNVISNIISNSYFATGIRVQSFGRQSRTDSSLSIDIAPDSGSGTFSFQINHRKNSDTMIASVLHTANGETSVLKQLMLPYAILPADIVLAVNKGSYIVNLSSLADSSFYELNGDSALLKQLGDKPFQTGIVFKSAVKNQAEMVVDNYFTGTASTTLGFGNIPLKVDCFSRFDPSKANWKLVFNDEFNGTKVDWDKKWYSGGYNKPKKMASLDGKGNLLIKTDFSPDGKKLMSSSLYSKKYFRYGYFEARLRFTKQPGWWASFWLISPCGFEIDIFEDYYTRPRKKGDPFGDILDHNLHIPTSGLLKSWNYTSKLPGSIDDFYVLGLKWTPFEISYYLNGKLIKGMASHSPYNSVTFDAVNHAFGTVPLQVGLDAGFPNSADVYGKAKDGKFPEYFIVDYVRVYEYPADNAPRVTWAKVPKHEIVAPGEMIIFDVKIEPAVETKSPIRCVYLFDNGYLVDYKEEAPYKFEFAIDKKHYENTPYMAPGRSGKKPTFNVYLHSFSIAAQDDNGKVGYSPVQTIILSKKGNKPYQGKAQVIPGTIKVGHYDEGGNNVAYCDRTPTKNTGSKNFRQQEGVDCDENGIGYVIHGEWIKYTVNISKSGEYDVDVRYGTPMYGDHRRIRMLLDNQQLGEFKLRRTGSFACNELTSLRGIKLPAGQHTITLLLSGGFNFSNIEFKQSLSAVK